MKTHLKDSDVPLIEGQNYFSHCVDVVPRAAFVAQSDDGASAESVILSASCWRCRKLASELTKKYLYLITAGQENENEKVGRGEITQC